MRKAVLVGVIALLAAGAFVVTTQGGRIVALSVGGAFILASVPLMALARVQLGKAFSVAPKATTLVTHGLYSKIPHPLFVFLDVALLGLAIAIRRRWLVAAWLVLVAVHAWAAAREAKVLARAFGDSYREYRARTWW